MALYMQEVKFKFNPEGQVKSWINNSFINWPCLGPILSEKKEKEVRVKKR